MFTLALFLTLCYYFILLLLSFGLHRLRSPVSSLAVQKISVIIAARNEEHNISTVIRSLLSQDYPSDCYEIIVVDDRSEDATYKMVADFAEKAKKEYRQPDESEILSVYRIPQDRPGGKKRALAQGIAAARFPILTFTDADCLPSPAWLREINRHFTDEVDFIAGYSPLISDKNTLMQRLKNLERLSIYAVTAGSLGWNYGITCTARNMAYRKKLYDQVSGFSGLEDIPSGDDDLMLQRMTPLARKMNFMLSPGSIVPSFERKSFTGQINLETRRASKWRLYRLPVKIGSAFVFVYYLIFLLLTLIFIFGGISLRQFLFLVLMKSLSELIILIPFLIMIKRGCYLLYYPVAFVLHLPYFLFFALKGTFGKYKWK